MLTQLSTLKARLEITVSTYDTLLTNAIKGVSTRFDNECNRVFGWGLDVAQEFRADQTEIALIYYPLGGIGGFHVKTNDFEDWVYQDGDTLEFLTRNNCLITFLKPLGTRLQQARITYSGGYILPGGIPESWQFPLPDDIEQAAVEQCAAWFLNRDKVGLEISWPSGGTYQRFSQLPLLPSVRETLNKYRRFTL